VSWRILLFAIASFQLLVANPSEAVEHYPTIPKLKGESVAVLKSSGICAKLADLILGHGRYEQVNPKTAREVLVTSSSDNPLLRVSYDSYETLTADFRRTTLKPCADADRENSDPFFVDRRRLARVYIFERLASGGLRRKFLSYPTCTVTLEASSLYCLEPTLSPGEIELEFAETASKESIDQLIADYGLVPLTGVESVDGKGSIFEVPVHQEETWLTALARDPRVAEVTRHPMRLASTNVSGEFLATVALDNKTRAPATISEVRLGVAQAVERAVAFLTSKFHNRGTVNFTERDAKRLEIVVTGLRGEVISGEHYWEKLKVDLIFSPDGNATTFYLIVDGDYATGVEGSAMPVDTAYSNMDNDYENDLHQYVQIFGTSLRTFLGKPT
jgi:hypothetical protein